ncbi:MAG TPA: galactokinase [Bacteroidaceae bacterium]|nr:galactokinase [Bacteroidaceae bacterium]
MNLEELTNRFIALYGSSDESLRIYFSPGRVNLIGEHTDYNGGFVFPCALSFGTYLLARKNNGRKLALATTNFDHRMEINLDKPFEKEGNAWINYPVGVVNEFRKLAREITGLDLLFSGDIPNGAGLSSSASIEMVTAYALNDMFGFGFDKWELVKLGQRAENLFVGVNCGIMDQFASCMGKKDHALFLNCDTLDYQTVPLELDGMKIVIANTNKRRGLADSKYNERRAQCDAAVESLRKVRNIRFLSDLNLDEFNEYASHITDETIRRRARHVISENDRTLRAIDELNAGNIEAFGRLMNQSHDSLRDDYEVTGRELDTLVEEARKIEGTIGSRMTGAGFGGCTVSIVKEDAIEEFTVKVGKGYHDKTGLKADFYIAEIGDGSKRIQ